MVLENNEDDTEEDTIPDESEDLQNLDADQDAEAEDNSPDTSLLSLDDSPTDEHDVLEEESQNPFPTPAHIDDTEIDALADDSPDNLPLSDAPLEGPAGLSEEALAKLGYNISTPNEACSGRIEHASEADGEQLTGWRGDDDLFGAAGDDVIDGFGGADFIDGGAGDDILMGDAGNDILLGGDGDDTLHGGEGQDILDGGDGDDDLRGNTNIGIEQLYPAWSSAYVTYDGEVSDSYFEMLDLLESKAFEEADFSSDILYGGAGEDMLVAGIGDVMTGGDGSDDFILGPWLADASEADLSAEPALITDFDPEEDSLVIVHDAETEAAPDDISVVLTEDGDSLVKQGDTVLARVAGVQITEADVVVAEYGDYFTDFVQADHAIAR